MDYILGSNIEAENKIVEIVKERNGLKATELVSIFIAPNILEIIDAMIGRKLIEIEYILPDSDRIKSFLLPSGTDITINRD